MKVEYFKNKTRNPERIPEILEELRKTWEEYPDLRLGQLITICANKKNISNLFIIEDDTLLEGVVEFGEDIRKGKQGK